MVPVLLPTVLLYLAFVSEELHGSLGGHIKVPVLAQSAGQPAEGEGLARHGYAHVDPCGDAACICKCICTQHQRDPD